MANKKPIMVVLDNIRSMHNVGSVFRTADGFLIDGICLCGFTPQPPHRDIHKTALGATETVDWLHYENTLLAVDALKQKGFKVYAIEQTEGSISLEKFKQLYPNANNEPLAFVFGNELKFRNGV
jgi:tRNA G18 (ribose-2'-O)-methylase SpoU